MTGARSLWRANGMKTEHFGKPIFAIANSFTQFVPGHRHLDEAGKLVKSIIEEAGYFAAEFNTIAIDDGIAMGHDGMLYSLPSREIIADSVEYMCNAHKADALICISNCDKITPGMLLAAFRLNIPTVFVSGGPMESGKFKDKKVDLVDAIVMGAQDTYSDEELSELEENACPTCGSCSGMFTANSMNCLTEALGLSLPGNGTIIATHKNRTELFRKASMRIIEMANQYYFNNDDSVLPKSIANKNAFMNAMTLDIAMGGSTNTILHLLAVAHEADVDFTLKDIDRLSRNTPCLSKVSPNSNYHIEDVNIAGGILSIMGELDKGGLLDTSVKRADGLSLKQAIQNYSLSNGNITEEARKLWSSAPSGLKLYTMGAHERYINELDDDRSSGCIRDIENAYDKDGGLAVLFGNIAKDGCVVKTAGVASNLMFFKGIAKVFDSQDSAVDAILADKIQAGDIVVIRYEGPKGGPGMQEMLYPTSYLKTKGLAEKCALITDGRFSGGSSGLSIGHISPEAASQGELGVVQDNDLIEIDIPNRKMNVLISDEELEKRMKAEAEKAEGTFQPKNRKRNISIALKMYALHAASADKGAARIL